MQTLNSEAPPLGLASAGMISTAEPRIEAITATCVNDDAMADPPVCTMSDLRTTAN
jgi:hypothetical protein